MSLPTDLEISRQARLRPLTEVAATMGLDGRLLEPYGDSVAKVKLEATEALADRHRAGTPSRPPTTCWRP
jgi:formate--tetrahydrofolate ligase